MSILNSWVFYIILALSATTAGLGRLSLSLHDDKVIAEQALAQAINVNTEMQKSLNLKDLSCKIDDKSVVELEADKSALKDKTEAISEGISKLPTGIKKLPTTNNMITEAPKNAEESNVLTGSELLSDDLRKLLLQSYCNVEPTDSKCVSTGQSVDASVQSHTSG